MLFNFYFKNGTVLKSKGEVYPDLFNNPNLVSVEVIHNNYKLKFDLTGARLIYFIKDGIPHIGKQKTVNGVNKKIIAKLKGKEVILDGI